MKRFLMVILLLSLASVSGLSLALSDPRDYEGSSDPALFSRMPGFHVYNFENLEFGRYEFQIGQNKKHAVEGSYQNINYTANDGVRIPSGLQVVRNYINAALAIGGKKIYEFEDGGTQYVTLKIVSNKSEVWLTISAANNGMYSLIMIEREAMQQDVIADASSLASNIKETGKAAVYGIYFDTGKAVIKPESDAALVEVANLMKKDGALKVYLVGHTDNVGIFDSNVKLSNARAAAVIKVLTDKFGISKTRMTPFGAASTSPVAANSSEEGRAKNRRVELVSQ